MEYLTKSRHLHYSDVIMSPMACQITSLTSVCSTVDSGRSEKTSKLRVTGLCAGNSPVTGKFPTERAIDAENVPIWWRHHPSTNKQSHPTEYYYPPMPKTPGNRAKVLICKHTTISIWIYIMDIIDLKNLLLQSKDMYVWTLRENRTWTLEFAYWSWVMIIIHKRQHCL